MQYPTFSDRGWNGKLLYGRDKPILFQIGEDQATLDKIKAAGFVQFTVSDPSLRGYNRLGPAIGEALTGQHNEPGCKVPDECTRTWNL